MKAEAWKKLIKKSCQAIGTYKPEFEPVIETLAAIMEKRDAAQEQFEEGGCQLTCENNGGKTIGKNPLLVVLDEQNTRALPYWRDLGLTPAGLKKINEKAMKGKQKSSFADILKDEFAK